MLEPDVALTTSLNQVPYILKGTFDMGGFRSVFPYWSEHWVAVDCGESEKGQKSCSESSTMDKKKSDCSSYDQPKFGWCPLIGYVPN